MTTRSLTVNTLDDLAVFKHLLPSLAQTVEAGFEYWFYLGSACEGGARVILRAQCSFASLCGCFRYDKGDPWLDNASNLATVRHWFDEKIATPLRRDKGIVIKLIYSTWTNDFHRPGPAFNHVTGVAYADGAEFIYRINDDQLFVTPWAKQMTSEILAMGFPYGVVGPACGEGATNILVVDMVHRTHHEIFPTHYPPSLQAWWMDNCQLRE